MGLTYLFTDIEGSTRLVQQTGYGVALRIHRHMLTSCVEEQGGQAIRSDEGDGSFFVFADAAKGVAAALAAQRKIVHNEWPDGLQLKVRMGLHNGPAVVSGGEHVGLSVHIAARVCGAAHGGQVLCSGDAARGVDLSVHAASLRQLGTYMLRGIDEPHALFQVCASDLQDDFPPPRGAVREGGTRVSIWQRASPTDAQAEPDLAALDICCPDGQPLPPDVHLEFRRASMGPTDSFRLLVSVDGTVEEEFDGLTIGGVSDAATIVNRHSTLIRLRVR